MIRLVPIELKEANRIVAEWHSHHKAVVGEGQGIEQTVQVLAARTPAREEVPFERWYAERTEPPIHQPAGE